MTWTVTGTHDKRYRVDTAEEIASWVADEVASITTGWMPLTSGRDSDGSLRVTYGRTPLTSTGPSSPVDAGPAGLVDTLRRDRVLLHGWKVLAAAVVFVATVALLARP